MKRYKYEEASMTPDKAFELVTDKRLYNMLSKPPKNYKEQISTFASLLFNEGFAFNQVVKEVIKRFNISESWAIAHLKKLIFT